jgi:hypothetical protein
MCTYGPLKINSMLRDYSFNGSKSNNPVKARDKLFAETPTKTTDSFSDGSTVDGDDDRNAFGEFSLSTLCTEQTSFVYFKKREVSPQLADYHILKNDIKKLELNIALNTKKIAEAVESFDKMRGVKRDGCDLSTKLSQDVAKLNKQIDDIKAKIKEHYDEFCDKYDGTKLEINELEVKVKNSQERALRLVNKLNGDTFSEVKDNKHRELIMSTVNAELKNLDKLSEIPDRVQFLGKTFVAIWNFFQQLFWIATGKRKRYRELLYKLEQLNDKVLEYNECNKNYNELKVQIQSEQRQLQDLLIKSKALDERFKQLQYLSTSAEELFKEELYCFFTKELPEQKTGERTVEVSGLYFLQSIEKIGSEQLQATLIKNLKARDEFGAIVNNMNTFVLRAKNCIKDFPELSKELQKLELLANNASGIFQSLNLMCEVIKELPPLVASIVEDRKKMTEADMQLGVCKEKVDFTEAIEKTIENGADTLSPQFGKFVYNALRDLDREEYIKFLCGKFEAIGFKDFGLFLSKAWELEPQESDKLLSFLKSQENVNILSSFALINTVNQGEIDHERLTA